MQRIIPIALILGLAWAVAGSPALAQKKPKIKETVGFAPSWKAAVEEAKLLNVPIVLHSHGFY